MKVKRKSGKMDSMRASAVESSSPNRPKTHDRYTAYSMKHALDNIKWSCCRLWKSHPPDRLDFILNRILHNSNQSRSRYNDLKETTASVNVLENHDEKSPFGDQSSPAAKPKVFSHAMNHDHDGDIIIRCNMIYGQYGLQ